MVYRETEATKANAAAKRAAIIGATIDIIARHGAEAVTVDLVAERVKGSVGMLYRYFPDKNEMIAAATARLLMADIMAMREATDGIDGVGALARGIIVLYSRMDRPRLVRAMLDRPQYREGIRDELAGLLRAASDMPARERRAAADAMLGALYGIYRASGGGTLQAKTAAMFALRCAGLSDVLARKAIEKFGHALI